MTVMSIASTPESGSPKWTPGPWRTEWDDCGFYHIQADGRPSPYVAATGSDGDVNEANARLIASAPDLYEAVCALLEGIELRLGEQSETGWHHDPEMIANARAALAKAGGGG